MTSPNAQTEIKEDRIVPSDHSALRALFVACCLLAASLNSLASEEAGSSLAASDEDAREAERAKQLSLADQRISQEQHEDALALLDALIADYAAQYRHDKRRIFCARTSTESAAYLIKAATEHQSAVTLGPTLAYAHYLRSYALTELGRDEAARGALELALSLSPYNPLMLAEHGHHQQLDRDWDAMLTTFQLAEEMVQIATPEDSQASEKGRALRGQGYALVELGRLEEAEQRYVQALAINAQDAIARDELAYVRRQRSAASP